MPALELHLYGFVTVALAGIGAGLTFDLLRGIRRRLRPGGLLAEALDLIYWLLVTGLVGVGIFLANRGELRLYVILGLATGALLYFILASPVLLWLVEAVLLALITLVSWILAALQMVVVRPLLWLAELGLRLVTALAVVGQRIGLLLVGPLKPVARRGRRWVAQTWAGRAIRGFLDWLLPRPPGPEGPHGPDDLGGPDGPGGVDDLDDPDDPAGPAGPPGPGSP